MVDVKVNENVSEYINSVIKKMSFKAPLKESIELSKYQTEANIANGGFEFGSFKPLKASTKEARNRRESKGIATVRNKTKKGVGGFKILVDTGAGLESFKTKSNEKEAKLWNTKEYMGFHQTGTRRMPKRIIYGVNKKTTNAIAQVFTNFFNKIFK